MTYAVYAYDASRNYTSLVHRPDELAARWYALEQSKSAGTRRFQYVIHHFDYDTNGWVFVAAYRDGKEMSDPRAIVSVRPGQVWRSRDDGSRIKVERVEGERVFGAYPDGSRPRSIAMKRFLVAGKHGYELEAGA